MEIGKMISKMDKELKHGLMGVNKRVIIREVKNMVTELMFGTMEVNIVEIGLKIK